MLEEADRVGVAPEGRVDPDPLGQFHQGPLVSVDVISDGQCRQVLARLVVAHWGTFELRRFYSDPLPWQFPADDTSHVYEGRV